MRRAPHGVVVAILAIFALPVAGCRRSDSSRADSGAAAAQTRAQSASPWAVSDSGAGPLRIGMTREELARALHEPPPARASADSGCTYLDINAMPGDMRTMWVAGTLARLEILTAELPTDRGARVGDSKARIDSLYGSRAATTAAKYDPNGSYIVVRPPSAGDSSRRLVFETDSTERVTRIRAGREPEVEWVEGCG